MLSVRGLCVIPPPGRHALTPVPSAAITSVLCVLSLIFPPRYFGTETSRLFALQKSGIITILLALVSFVLALVTFIVEIVVAIPAKNRLDAIEGISAELVRFLQMLMRCIRAGAYAVALYRATSSGSLSRASFS